MATNVYGGVKAYRTLRFRMTTAPMRPGFWYWSAVNPFNKEERIILHPGEEARFLAEQTKTHVTKRLRVVFEPWEE